MFFELIKNEEAIIVSIIYNDSINKFNIFDDRISKEVLTKIKEISSLFFSTIDNSRYKILNNKILFYRIEDAEALQNKLNEGV